jgi:hypothetical protein
MPPYTLSEVGPATGGAPRILHGLAARAPLTFLRRGAEVAFEITQAALLDRIAPLKGGLREVSPGEAPRQGKSLALYLHWSPDGRVSPMVLRQLALWRECGFDLVFVTNAPHRPPEADWAEVGARCLLRIHRENVGRDFGGWRDAAAVAVAQYGPPEELLLANDSVLGPFLPLAPVVAAWRAGGAGLFGLTESLGGGPHLQSYALLARGEAAVGLLLAHLAAFRDSRSKWRVVQQGELGLTRRARAAGLPCAALFGYARLTALVDEATRASLGPRFAAPEAFARYPLNPCHHLWRVLVERMGFPYLKTELVRRNPGRLPGVEDWPALMAPEDAALIREHLKMMGP